MPKDKKKARRDSSSSDSGPEDKGPAKKAKPAAGSSSGSCTMENGEPTWLVGGMKFVKVFSFSIPSVVYLLKVMDFRTFRSKEENECASILSVYKF